jgi:hypothetical protein
MGLQHALRAPNQIHMHLSPQMAYGSIQCPWFRHILVLFLTQQDFSMVLKQPYRHCMHAGA